MDLRLFVVAGLFGRGIRFGMEGLVLGIWDDEFLGLMKDPLAWLVAGLLGLLLFIPVMDWWTGLAEATDSE